MITISSVLTILSMVSANAPAFAALGADVVDMFEKGKALVSSDTATTPEERTAVMAEIATLEAQRDVLLADLEQRAPQS